MFAGKLHLFVLVWIIVCVRNAVESRRGYVFTFPQELQVGAEETFCLSLFNVTSDVTLHLNISCYGKVVKHQPDVFIKGEHGCFGWELPESLTAGACELHVSGGDEDGDFMFSDSQELEVVDNYQTTFIQTDRRIYKPGDTVQFRILTITQNLLPVITNIDSVIIQDPNDFYMKRWTDLPVKAGLASLDYMLYDEPVLGEWQILVEVNGRRTRQQFSVQEYVLPKFEVSMILPESLTVATEKLQFQVCARYTFGKPVTGKLNASVCLVNSESSWFCEDNVRPCITVTTAKMDGCHNFTVQTDKLKITDRRFSLLCKPKLTLRANVTEKNGGEVVEAEETGTGVWEQRVKLTFQSNNYFKPFFPYTGKVFASLPDGSPAANEKIVLTIGKLGVSRHLETDSNGLVTFSIQNLTHNTDFFVLHIYIGKLGVSRHLETDSNGLVTFSIQNLTHNIDFFVLHAKTLDKESVDTKLYTIFPATTKKQVKQWYSPTSSYIQLSAPTGDTVLSCGKEHTVDVVYSLLPDSYIETFMYQVISRGNILDSQDILHLVGSSLPYSHTYTGLVFTPKLRKDKDGLDPDSDSEESPFDPLDGPTGPAGGSPRGDGPPGLQPGAPAPGPPGSQEKNGPKAPVAPLTHVDLSHTSGSEEIDIEGPGFALPPELWQVSIKVNVTEQMSPKLRLLVYLVTDQGEMVADTLDLAVENCYKNKVAMQIKESSRRPGDKVHVSISASPHSLCSASLVDSRVTLLGGHSLLLPEHVNKKLEQFDLTSDFINDWQYCSDLSDMPPVLSAAGPFKESGAPGSMHEDVEIYAGRFRRRKRSIMQFYSNMYDSLLAFKSSAPDVEIYAGRFRRRKRSIMQFYSNMYDSLLAFKVAGVRALSDLDLQTRPCLHDGSQLGPPLIPGEPHGPVPGPYNKEPLALQEGPIDNAPPKSKFRRDFRDTWLWDLYEIPANGTVTVTPRLPDTITQWVGNSFCTNTQTGLGVSDITSVYGFQPFFISVKLPYSVVRGDLVHVGVEVYNYLKHCIDVHIGLAKNSDFVIEGHTKKDASFCICNSQSRSHTFKIRPHSLGSIKLTFTAFLKEHRVKCGGHQAPPGYAHKQVTDMVVKELLVEPEGVTEERTQSLYICPKDSPAGVFKKQLQPDIPQSLVVKDSLRSWINVIGDIMGPVLSGLEGLVQLPTGCGEQNMVRLAPNIAVLEYLTTTGQLNNDIETRILDHLHKGYQQQLKFMHKDGAFSAFGKADDHGSTWLSAFVFKTLRKASNFIYVDRKQIQVKTWEFLITQQQEDGCFEETGKMMSKYMTGGVAGSQQHKRRALTAYILAAMLESFKMMKERTPPFVSLAVKCIEVDSLNDTYTLALTAYAMTLYKPDSPFTDAIITRLKEAAIIEGDVMYWKRSVQPDILSGQGRAASAEVEITAYALLALLTQDSKAPINNVLPIVRWMTAQRNAYGGFSSTQDTVVALQALSLFAQRVYGGGLNVSVSVADDDGDSMQFRVTQGNSIILQQQDLSQPTAPLHVTAQGVGCILLQLTSHYNMLRTVVPESTSFALSISSPVTMDILNNNCRTRTIRVCTSYIGADNVSDMAIVEVKLTSGWIVNVKSLDKLLNLVGVDLKKYEMNNKHPDVVNFYFDQLSSMETCFEFSIVLEVEVENTQVATARVFDYYDTDEQALVLYKLSPCTEDNVELEISLLEKDVLLGTEKNIVVHNSNHIQTAKPDQEPPTKPYEENNNVPSPNAEIGCPQCVLTGPVSILDDICKKQVWKLERVGRHVSIQIVASDSVSPPLQIPMPAEVQSCNMCDSLLLQEGQASLAVLEATDWQNLGLNIAKSDTVVIPWSSAIQVAIQHTLDTC